MLDWTLVTLLFIILAAGLVLHRFLRGPSLRAYDPPVEQRPGGRDTASTEHQEAVRLLEQATSEIRSAPLKQRLAAIRRVMEQGFLDPALVDTAAYRIEDTNAGGVPGEWVLAPQSDPNRRVLYLHGGAFVSGCPRGHRMITTRLARATGAAVLALDYRLMPEHSRRDMIADCQAGYRWILDHGPNGPAPVGELFVAGDSAGGNLALMLIAWARDAGLRTAHGAMALSPSVDMTLSSPTFKSNRNTDLMLGPGLGRFLRLPKTLFLLLTWGWSRMVPSNPLISPVFGDLSRLPPVLVQASEAEMMLGDARRYVNKARAAGSRAELETWPGMLHVWHIFEPILPEAQEAFERIRRFVDRCLGNR
ncbi:MAG TPA: alpha/beta hydrolase [Candidatus Contendobacter sp.]|jgi:acetyl esterase/lipase|nr:alpha/beta hydrolase [Candidatus Contendobacter sp.]HRZ24497.1 alpha/beta hydrolase [Candidatus Contendobacter sp.]HRZ52895.1 alpha/beta hydrolase [Candidatus Contendobacter sp.]